MPRCFSISSQSEVAWRWLLRALTVPASWMAPPYIKSFSVSVVLPASGCEMIANVRRRATFAASVSATWAISPAADSAICVMKNSSIRELKSRRHDSQSHILTPHPNRTDGICRSVPWAGQAASPLPSTGRGSRRGILSSIVGADVPAAIGRPARQAITDNWTPRKQEIGRCQSYNQPKQNLAISRSITLQLAESQPCGQPMSKPRLYPRFIDNILIEALEDAPVVLIHGPRQCGKSTLANMVCDKQGYTYTSFDDEVMRQSAEADPIGFV